MLLLMISNHFSCGYRTDRANNFWK